MKPKLLLIIISTCLLSIKLSAASYPTDSYTASNEEQQTFGFQENNINNEESSLLMATYYYGGVSNDFTYTGSDYSGHPIYGLTAGGSVVAGDDIYINDIGGPGTGYTVSYFVEDYNGYWWLDTDNDNVINGADPLFENIVPIKDDLLLILIMLGIYLIHIVFKHKKYFRKKELA